MEMDRINYIDALNDVIIYSKIDLVDQICVSIYAFTSMYKQANQSALKLEPQVHANTKQNAARNKIRPTINHALDLERKTLQGQLSLTSEPNGRLTEKEGFLFKQNTIKEWLL
jgi:hypothetical protein